MENKKIRIFIIILILVTILYIGYTKYINIDNLQDSNKIPEIEMRIQTIGSLGVSEFKQELDAGDKILIDIRTQEELDTFGLIGKDALHFDFYANNFSEQLDKLNKSEKYLIYCYHGNRSKGALDIMKELGFEYVKDLNGGIDAWINNGEKVFK